MVAGVPTRCCARSAVAAQAQMVLGACAQIRGRDAPGGPLAAVRDLVRTR